MSPLPVSASENTSDVKETTEIPASSNSTMPSPTLEWTTLQDGLSKLTLKESNSRPSLGSKEVLVQINAVALNYRDTEVAMGLYKHHNTFSGPQEPLVPCSDMCGTVVESNSTLWSAGDKVLSIFNQTHLKGQVKAEHMKHGLGSPLPGVLAQYRVFPEFGLVRKPAYLQDEQAATLPIAGLTAWMAMNGMRELGKAGGKGETVLIQGTGGVAISGLQIAKASQAKVIVTSSDNLKLERARAKGADITINYRQAPDWELSVLAATEDLGVDIIFENGGASTLRKSFDCIAFGGLINCIGYLGGKEDTERDRTNTNVLALRRNVTLKGILNEPRERFEEMLEFYEKHRIVPVVDRIFEFGEAKEALEYLYSGGHFGKVVVRVL